MRKHELLKLQTDDVQDLGSKYLVTVKASKTHTNRIFTIVDNEQKTLLSLIKRYISLRPVHTQHKRFFIFYKNGKCSTQPIGVNTFSKLPSIIATFLKLEQPHLYTGHCFRRSSASILSDNGADFSAIKRLGGWKSTAVAEGYIENSLQNKINTAKKILCETATQACHTSSTDAEINSVTNIQNREVNLNLKSQNHTTVSSAMSPLSFNNCTISTINIYHYKHKNDND